MEKQLPDEQEKGAWQGFVGTEKALSWYGFASPVGLSILAISIGIAAVLFRVALLGF